jgi:hypothetical protein
LKAETIETGRHVPMFQRKYLLVIYPNDLAVNFSGSMKCGEILDVMRASQPKKKNLLHGVSKLHHKISEKLFIFIFYTEDGIHRVV